MSSETHQLQSPVLVIRSVRILQLDLVSGKPRCQTLHAWQRTLSLPCRYLEHFATHPPKQRWRWRFLYSTSKAKHPTEIYSQAEAGWKLVGSEARNFGVAAMLDIGRISVRGSIKAHSSIYRRHQRSARTKPALYVWYRNMVERILVGDGGLSWQIRTG